MTKVKESPFVWVIDGMASFLQFFFQSDSCIFHILPRGSIAVLTKLVAKKVLNHFWPL